MEEARKDEGEKDLQDKEGGLDFLLGQKSQELIVVHAGTIIEGQGDDTGLGAGIDLGGVIGHDGSGSRGQEKGTEGESGGSDLHCEFM